MRGGKIADWIEMDCGQGRGKLDNLGFFQEKGGRGRENLQICNSMQMWDLHRRSVMQIENLLVCRWRALGIYGSKDANILYRDLQICKIMQAGEIFC